MNEWIDVASVDDLPEGGRLCVTVAGRSVVVLNVAGVLHAIDNTCPHAGRPLEDGEVRGHTITCPYHGYCYNLRTGANLDYPGVEPPVRLFPVRVDAGKVQVSTADTGG